MILKAMTALSLFLSFNCFSKEYILLTQEGEQVNKSYNVIRSFKTSVGTVNIIKSHNKLNLQENETVQIMAVGNPQDVYSKTTSYSQIQWGLENRGDNEPIRPNRRSPVPGVLGSDSKAPLAWKINSGDKKITVAVVDTGVDYNHSDLRKNMWMNQAELYGKAGVDDDGNGFIDDIQGWDFVNNDNDPQDDMGHGTHCAGIIGANHDEKGIKGVMSEVSLMAIKFLDKKGRGTIEQTIKAMDYAVSLKPDVINASWGSSRENDVIKKIIERALKQGTVIVAAAGNLRGRNNDVSPTYPASYNYPNVISVSSHNAQDYHSAFSSWGPLSVHIAAPGTNIISTYKDEGYKVWSGTSMAAPHVSGAIGLLKSHSRFEIKNLKNRLMETTDYVEGLKKYNKSSGRLNIEKLLNNERRQI